MRIGFYWSYTTRSLRRGGQRTVLAVFCIAVGVMAIVALQLASLMVSNNLTSNVRSANGGDISVRSDVVPFRPADLSFFAGLQRAGTLARFTALTDDRGVVDHGPSSYPVVIGVIDPAQYPLVGQPTFAQPAHGDLRRLLSSPHTVVIARAVADNLHVGIGAEVRINGGGGRTLAARVTGLLASGGLSSEADALVPRATYARSGATPLTYNVVYITTTSDTRTTTAARLIKNRYPLATVQTVADALKARQQYTALLHELLQVIGILALLIGGFGVVNTMNVLLARRRTEIAMLKTAGYQRRDLYALFGLEAALLGLLGGVVGAVVGVGLSWGVKSLIENAFQLQLPFVVDPTAIIMGVVVGLCTAVIFGLLPVVRAALIRPQAVLRDVPERPNWGSRLGSAGLVLLLSVLFFLLATVILGDWRWGLGVVYGTFILLGLLSVVFGALILLIGRLPIPEHLTLPRALISTVALLLASALTVVLPSIGVLLVLLVVVLGFGVAFLPRPWQATIKLSLRDIGRQRTRATMTLLALFVGVFSVGLIVILGQDVRSKISGALASQITYNVYSLVPVSYAGSYDTQLRRVAGLRKHAAVNAALTVPLAVNGRSIEALLGGPHVSREAGAGNLGVSGTEAYLSGLTGYTLGRQPTDAIIARGAGRDLTPRDAGTTNVLLPSLLHVLGPLHLKLDDRITLSDVLHTHTLTVRVVGFYTTSLFSLSLRYPILAAHDTVQLFGGPEAQYIYSLKVDPTRADAAVAQLNRTVPHAVSLNLTNLGAIVDQVLGNLVVLLVALASLALFAGVIIIANAVALAMLERRREQGILKSVGYTSGRVLAGVLVENGVIGGLGGILGMTLVAVATGVLARSLFKTALDVPGVTTLGLILLVTAIAIVTAVLVSWNAVRVRPVEVLRYE